MRDGGFGEFIAAHFRGVVIILSIIVIICVGALIALPFLVYRPKISSIEISVAPSFAKIEINGQTYNNGVHEFEPGEYEAVISADGFESKKVKVTVEKEKSAKLSDYLLNTEEGLAYFERSEADLRSLEAIDKAEIKEFLDDYRKKVSIREVLPIDASYDMAAALGLPGNELYEQTVKDGSNDPRCKKAFCLLVTGYKLNEAKIREAVSAKGYNLANYEVIYDF